jgi:hypothetical protein
MNKVDLNTIDSEEVKRIVINALLKVAAGEDDGFGWFKYVKPTAVISGVPECVVKLVFDLFENNDLNDFEDYDDLSYRG